MKYAYSDWIQRTEVYGSREAMELTRWTWSLTLQISIAINSSGKRAAEGVVNKLIYHSSTVYCLYASLLSPQPLQLLIIKVNIEGYPYSAVTKRTLTDFLLPKDPNKHLLKICDQSSYFLLTCFINYLDMDRITTHACALPLVHYMLQCHPDFETPHPVLEARQQTAPDGQVLPEWLTWSPVRKRRDQAYDSTRLPSMGR